jgi:hypothetical protein
MKHLLIFGLLIFTTLSCGLSREIDIVNAYEFKFGNTFLFNEYDKFIAEMGLPDRFITFTDTIDITSKDELDLAIKNEIDSGKQFLHLHYPGFVMDCFTDYRIVPERIDFRKTDENIQFNKIFFNRDFTIEEFRKLFPISSLTPLSGELSLFNMITQENIPDLESFIVLRKSVDVPSFLGMEGGPVIEFSFQKGKLIYMYFANF